MKRLTMSVMAFSLLALGFPQAGHTQASSGDRAQTVEITRNGSQSSTAGSAENFMGSVRINPLFPVHDPARASGVNVTFEPGARTAWHTHPLGQTLIVTTGVGWVQQWGGQIQEMRPGDVVWIHAARAAGLSSLATALHSPTHQEQVEASPRAA